MNEPAEIKKLDETVINRIAAGEVIQRPANALKEMIENCLDAKSTNIQVIVKNGGLKLLQIQDNGAGIRRDDFEIVCERFTTSKLREFEDLSSISTYGFRGEALASISHVAHLTILSKTASEKCAYKASFEDGKLKDHPKPAAGNQGTQITVEDLFYNMAVRKRALRSPAEEYQKIADVVGKYSIHNAKVGFGLKKHGENNDIRTPPSSNAVDNIRTIYGNNIARELIDFRMENEKYKFTAQGQITNVNYSSKKFVFLLFINHRLVDCPSLKKCLDQVYTTYLPKNMHPFVYLSVELDPKNIDVNVHPTKHEVHFMNEDQIVDLIMKSVETQLLGSNNSRMFYTQSKLPVVIHETMDVVGRDDKKSVKPTYDKNLVRTDSTEQKLDKFFGAPTKKKASQEKVQGATEKSLAEVISTEKILTEKISIEKYSTEKCTKSKGSTEKEPKNAARFNETMDDHEFEALNKEFLKKNEDFENKILERSITASDSSPEKNVTQEMLKRPKKALKAEVKAMNAILAKIPRAESKLTSVLELRLAIEDNCHMTLRQLFSQHVFVGCIDPTQTLLQFSTKLYLCNTQKIAEELFYQFLMYNFENLDILRFTEPLPIRELALEALNLPESGWTIEDGDKTDLSAKVTEILTERADMLSEYFSMEVDDAGRLKSLPQILENYSPDLAGLPMYLLRLATEVNWDSEKDCFDNFARETAVYYSQLRKDEDSNWKWITEYVLYPAVKDYFLPPKSFVDSAAILQIADLPNLYKVFERC